VQVLQDVDLTDIRAQRNQSTPWYRRCRYTPKRSAYAARFKINNRQVLPIPMIAHIKANGSATVAGNRYARGRAWRIAWPSRTRF